MSSTSAPAGTVSVFLSYAHKDERFVGQLVKHLAILKRQGVIAFWSDREISLGQDWTREISQHLETAKIILFMVSPYFLASDFCYGIEVKQAMERHKSGEARVIPIILSPVDWLSTPFADLQALPKNAKPLTSWANRDAAFADVTVGIRKAVKELAASSLANHSTASGNEPGQDIGFLPRVWNVPYGRNPNFIDRHDLLAELENTLKPEPTTIISGLAGIGKTQLVIEYLYRHTKDYEFVWWVRAANADTLATDYAQLASVLQLPEQRTADQAAMVLAVRSWLEHHPKWLLVLDDAQRPEDVISYLPQTKSGRVLITSRNPNWRSSGAIMIVQPLSRASSVDFLLRRTGQTDEAEAAALAEDLGDLPLALEQVGAYIESMGATLADYKELYNSRRKVLGKHEWPSVDYRATIATTWELSFAQVAEQSLLAVDLLNLCAYLASNDIPLELLTQGRERLPNSVIGGWDDPLVLKDTMLLLGRYGLIEFTLNALSVNPLVQTILRERLSEKTQRKWAETALFLVNSAFPLDSDEMQNWPECERLLPHAMATIEHVEELRMPLEAAARLSNQIGLYFSARAHFSLARDAYERALRISEEIYGPDHPTVATYLNNLGNVLEDIGELQEAFTLYQRALEITEASYGPSHPAVSICLSSLGSIERALGMLTEAHQHYKRALTIDESNYGPNHPQVATELNNLGALLIDLGQLDVALDHFRRALDINKQALGHDHAAVATSLSNLGSVSRELGLFAEARLLYEEALAIDESIYGPNHPQVGADLNNLGVVFRGMQYAPEARNYFERALRISEEIYGPNHPTVATYLNNLGNVLEDIGELQEAFTLYQRALEITEASYGPQSQRLALLHTNSGRILASLGNVSRAREHWNRALEILKPFEDSEPLVTQLHENLRNLAGAAQ